MHLVALSVIPGQCILFQLISGVFCTRLVYQTTHLKIPPAVFIETQSSTLFLLCLAPDGAYYILIVWLLYKFFHHSKAINFLMDINFVVKEQSSILRL